MAEPKLSRPSSRSWRGGAKAATNYNGPSNAARIFWSLAFLGLTGFLIWKLWPISRPEAQFAAVGVIYQDATPIPFCSEDAEAFASLNSGGNAHNQKDLGRSDTISKIWGEKSQGNVPVIVYLAARGVSDADGKAWILCSDYKQSSGRGQEVSTQGRYALHDLLLLSEAKQRQAPLKLLILDASYAASDPGAGMMINEFPALLEKEIMDIHDDNLWVLTNARSPEVEHFSLRDGRSAFSYFVTEGLRGQADTQPRDGFVDLDELYDFLLRGVGNWVRMNRDKEDKGRSESSMMGQNRDYESQTPCLFHAGEGLVRDPHRISPGLHVCAVIGRSKAGTGPEGADPTGTAGDPAPPKPLEAEDVLQAAWKEHDELLDHGTGSDWTIDDVAPHLWREYENILLDLEFRLISGTAHADRKADLKKKVDLLGLLPTGGSAADISDDMKDRVGRQADPIARLNQARLRFQQQRSSFEDWAKKEHARFEAFQARNRGIRIALYGLRWHQAVLPFDVNKEAHYAARLDHLRELLSSLQRLSVEDVDEAEKKKVERHAGALVDSWQQEAKDLANEKLPADGRSARIDALLAIPVLRAEERIALLRARRDFGAPLSVPERLPTLEMPAKTFDPSPSFIDRINSQAELERLAFLVESRSVAGDLEPKLDWPQIKGQNADISRENCRQFGGKLVKWQADLRNKLLREAQSLRNSALSPSADLLSEPADFPTVAAVDRVLRWADARDVTTVNILPPPKTQPVQATLTVKLLAKERKLDNPYDFTLSYGLTLSLAGTDAVEAEMCWNCDNPELAKLMNVKFPAGQEPPLSPGEWRKIGPINNVREVELSVGLAKAMEKLGPLDGLLIAKARVPHVPEGTDNVKIHVPRPNAIGLLVYDAAGGTLARSTVEGKPISVRPFPNRETAFLLKVENQSEFDKDLSVELVVPRDSPPSSPEYWGPAAGPQTNAVGNKWDGKVLNGDGGLVASVVSPFPPILLKVPAGKAVALPFPGTPPLGTGGPSDKPADKPGDASAVKPGAIPAGDNVTKAGLPVERGWALLISDTADKTRHWVERFEFKPYKPSDFLKAEIKYNEASRELHAVLTAKERVPFPLDAVDKPIQVQFDTDPHQAALAPQALKDRSQQLDFSLNIAPPAPLSNNAGTDNSLRFFFDIDGYPHALQYINPDWSNQPEKQPVEDDTVAVEIVSPQPEACFDVRQAVKVPLKFKVHARSDFLYHTDESLKDWIEIRTFDQTGTDAVPWTEASPKRFYTRQPVILLRGPATPGKTGAGPDWIVSTTVGSFDAPFTLALPKQKVRIEIKAHTSYLPKYSLPASDPRSSPKSLWIVLDSLPEVEVLPLPGSILLGQPLPVELSVKSVSPIEQLDCGFEDPDKPDAFAQEPKKVKAAKKPGAIDAWVATIPTDKVAPGKQTLLFKVRNGVGEKVEHRPFLVEAPVTDVPATKPMPPKKGRIEGDVVYKFQPTENCKSGTVRLDGKDGKEGRKVDIKDGKFAFDDVPYGLHKLSAHVEDQGRKYEGELEVDLDDSTKKQTIPVTLKESSGNAREGSGAK
jgi:hypothetical protein